MINFISLMWNTKVNLKMEIDAINRKILFVDGVKIRNLKIV